ncbi:hypothetical protein MHYP_G00322570 [Metynnis hypsauchen]
MDLNSTFSVPDSIFLSFLRLSVCMVVGWTFETEVHSGSSFSQSASAAHNRLQDQEKDRPLYTVIMCDENLAAFQEAYDHFRLVAHNPSYVGAH